MEVASLCLIQEIVFVHNNSIDLQLAKVANRALHIGEQSVNCYKPACTTLPVADLAKDATLNQILGTRVQSCK